MIESVNSAQRLALANRPAVNMEVCKKLIDLTDDAYCTVRLFKGIFMHEPFMAAAVIRMANSQALKKPICSLNEAISMLGWKKVRGIVASICLQGISRELNPALRAVWEQCSLRTIIGRELSVNREVSIKENVEYCSYVLGLGKFQLATENPDKYLEVIDLVKSGCNLKEAEQAKYGFIAYVLSSKLCKNLKLPEYFLEIIDNYVSGNLEEQAYDILTLAESLSVAILYQNQELEGIKSKLRINNTERFLSNVIKEHTLLKKISGFN